MIHVDPGFYRPHTHLHPFYNLDGGGVLPRLAQWAI